MGTRNLTIVQADGEYKIAQYSQWDGYPSGQGKTVLDFCRRMFAEGKWDAFKKKLALVKLCTNDEIEKMYFDLKINVSGDFISVSDAKKFDCTWPCFSRDIGAEILNIVMDSEKEVCTKSSIDFAGDSLFCEWAYVVDLDKNILEVYKGFNQVPLSEGDRFYGYAKGNSPEYHPVVKLKSFDLGSLPTDEEFYKIEETEDEESS
jgi:hypothetical protein